MPLKSYSLPKRKKIHLSGFFLSGPYRNNKERKCIPWFLVAMLQIQDTWSHLTSRTHPGSTVASPVSTGLSEMCRDEAYIRISGSLFLSRNSFHDFFIEKRVEINFIIAPPAFYNQGPTTSLKLFNLLHQTEDTGSLPVVVPGFQDGWGQSKRWAGSQEPITCPHRDPSQSCPGFRKMLNYWC